MPTNIDAPNGSQQNIPGLKVLQAAGGDGTIIVRTHTRSDVPQVQGQPITLLDETGRSHVFSVAETPGAVIGPLSDGTSEITLKEEIPSGIHEALAKGFEVRMIPGVPTATQNQSQMQASGGMGGSMWLLGGAVVLGGLAWLSSGSSE